MREQSIPFFYDEKAVEAAQYGNLIQGIRNASAKSGFRMKMISEKEADSIDIDQLQPVAIIASANMPYIHRTIERLREHGRHAVLAGTDAEPFGHDVSCVTPSRRSETRQMVNYLHSCGRERIALVGFGKNSVNDTFRYHAAMNALAAWGRFLREEDVWMWRHDPCDSFDSFLDVCTKYDAAICPNDIMAIRLVNHCRLRKIRVPEDLFVVSFGNMEIGKFHRPSITSMTMDMLCVGEQAYNIWRFLLNNESARNAVLKISVPSRILARESTMCIMPELCEPTVSSMLQADRFYEDPTISVLVGLENCITQRDAIDMQAICGIMDEKSYEQIASELFISGSTLRYRLNKIFADAGVRTRHEFEALIHTYLGEGNPFANLR